MPSPFPGMNPYWEQPLSWLDFHHSFSSDFRSSLVSLVGPNYYVGLEERLYLSEWPFEESGALIGLSDLSLHPLNQRVNGGSAATATVKAPIQVSVDIPEAKLGLSALVIRDRLSDEIVTVIEILSPSNKYPGDDRAAYMEKRAEVMRTRANLVELDLLRGGPKLPSRGMKKCDYHILVSRPNERPNAGVWPFQLRDPIPRFPVPLRSGETDVIIDLKPVLDETYDRARHARRIYRHPPVPPLAPEDAAWAEGILKSVVPA